MGEIIAAESSAATKTVAAEQQTGISALREACSGLVDRMLPKLLEYWRKEAFGTGKTVQMVVRGLSSLSDLGSFETSLRYSLRGIKKLLRGRYGPVRPGGRIRRGSDRKGIGN